MGFRNESLRSPFDNTDRKRVARKFRKKFTEEKVFSLTGKRIKRSKGIGAFG